MTTQKRIMKILIVIILVMFLLSSVLLSVMYFFDGSKNQSADTTGDLVDT
jgi:flagellar basal body-associated protein FliL